MTSARITQFLRSYLAKGYTKEQLQEHLLQQGISKKEINQSFAFIEGKSFFDKYKLFLAIGGICCLIIVSLLLLFISSPEVLLDVELEAIDDYGVAGRQYEFLVNLISLGDKARVDAEVIYRLYNARTKTLVTTKQESVALETRMAKQAKILLPKDIELGTYQLSAVVKYNGKLASSLMEFKIREEVEKEEETVKEDVEEEVMEIKEEKREIEEKREEEIMIEEKKVERVITDGRTIPEVVGEIIIIAETNPGQAIAECEVFQSRTTRDYCLSRIVDVIKEISVCEKIQDKEVKDRCIISYVMETKDFKACPEIEDIHLKDSCYALESLQI